MPRIPKSYSQLPKSYWTRQHGLKQGSGKERAGTRGALRTTGGQTMKPQPVPHGKSLKPPKRPPTSEIPERLIDSEEAAAIIGIHPKTLQRYARRGLIRGVHVGKLWRFRGSTIEEWIERAELAS